MRVWLLAAVCVTVAGCSSGGPSGAGRAGGAGGPGQADVVREVVGLLRNHMAQFNRGPAKVADLARYESEYPFGFRAVQSGDVVVVWGATVAGEGGGGGSEEVVAYEKAAPEAGGAVGLANGQVKAMTAAEFAAAPKAAAKK